jgi:hypothetical protein
MDAQLQRAIYMIVTNSSNSGNKVSISDRVRASTEDAWMRSFNGQSAVQQIQQ